MEAYYQEIGRAGRDGLLSKAILYYNNSDIAANIEIDKAMTEFCRSSDKCLRTQLLAHFDTFPKHSMVNEHACCQVCQKSCKCDTCALSVDAACASIEMETTIVPELERLPVRIVGETDREKILVGLKALRMKIGSERRYRFVGISVSTGLTESTIERIVNDVEYVRDADSLRMSFPIWNPSHADQIIEVINSFTKTL